MMLISCAAQKRAPLTRQAIIQEREDYLKLINNDHKLLVNSVIKRIKRNYDEYIKSGGNELPNFDVLILSGGGEYGAFGAGFLQGWGDIKEGEFKRPDFDSVTGVSTGSLIAPFAFIGTDESYSKVVELYGQANNSWVKMRSLAILPEHISLLDDTGYQNFVRENIDTEIVNQLNKEASKDKTILIGSTNIDQGMMRIFNLHEIAKESAKSGSTEKVADVLLASSAMPVAFPPIEIDNQLYVDGGASVQFFFGPNLEQMQNFFKLFKKRYPDIPIPKLRLWIIVNDKLSIKPEEIELKWLRIGLRSLQTLMRASRFYSLGALETGTFALNNLPEIRSEFRYVAIPDDFDDSSNDEMFNPDTIKRLIELGRKMGADPNSWQTKVPDLEWSSGHIIDYKR